MFVQLNFEVLTDAYAFLMLTALVAQWVAVPVGVAVYLYALNRRSRWY